MSGIVACGVRATHDHLDTLFKMTWSALPPVGCRIATRDQNSPLPDFAGYSSIWLNSGTASLALALIAAKGANPSISTPEVILPAYGCPDLVAAALYAGLQPVLADIGSNDPGYELDAVAGAITPHTVAVVAVNFLGIRERLDELRKLIRGHRIALVEDDAQWFPETTDFELQGDAVSLSFGRGKPVSLLGGGGLLLKHGSLPADLLNPYITTAPQSGWKLRWKMHVYNASLGPFLYGALSRMPFVGVGRTRFRRLKEISRMDQERQRLLQPNVERHLHRRTGVATEMRRNVPGEMNLPDLLQSRSGRLLRYPVICRDARIRDSILEQLRRNGLGATAMYRHVLPEIGEVRDKVRIAGGLSGATSFAGRLLTLPVHDGVDADHIHQISRILRQY